MLPLAKEKTAHRRQSGYCRTLALKKTQDLKFGFRCILGILHACHEACKVAEADHDEVTDDVSNVLLLGGKPELKMGCVTYCDQWCLCPEIMAKELLQAIPVTVAAVEAVAGFCIDAGAAAPSLCRASSARCRNLGAAAFRNKSASRLMVED